MDIYPSDWRIRLAGAVGAMVGGAIGLFVVKPLIELPGWLGALAFGAFVAVGVILGKIVGQRLFRTSSAGPPDHPPRT